MKLLQHLTICAVLCLTLSSCTFSNKVPQTREEFINNVIMGKGLTKTETITVSKDFDVVFKSIKRNMEKCLSDRVTERKMDSRGMKQISTRHYNTTALQTSNMTGEVTTQVEQEPRLEGPAIPENGFYIFAIDVNGTDDNKTEVILYGASLGWDDVFSSVKHWAENRQKACPKHT